MTLLLLIPVFLPMLCGILAYILGRKTKKGRSVFCGAVCLFVLGVTVAVTAIYSYNGEIILSMPMLCCRGLNLKIDGFRAVYCVVAAIMWACTTLFCGQYLSHYHNRGRYYLFTLMTLGATMGVFMSADLYTTFVFFEIMSFTSYTWVAHEETKKALRAAETYLAIAVIGGMVLLMGLFMLENRLGTLDMSQLRQCAEALPDKSVLYLPCALMLVGFGAKAGAFPLHIWLPKAHPVAPAPASALLSGILTKSGVYGIIIISGVILFGDGKWGTAVFIIGLVTMLLGAVLALFSIDLKRTLACSSMSQIGFILIGIGAAGVLGEEGALAVRGTVLHMVNHSLIKLVLFTCAGIIYMNAHTLDLTELKGYGRGKPVLTICFLLGALGIMGVPLLNGYVSKTLLHESIIECAKLTGSGFFALSEWLFLLAGGLTVAYMTKLFVAIFIEKPKKAFDGKCMNTVTALSVILPTLLLAAIGVIPNITADRIADTMQGIMNVSFSHTVSYFSFENLKGAAISIAVGALVYCLIVRKLMIRAGKYVDIWPKKLDLEELFYRPLVQKWLPAVLGFIACIVDNASAFLPAVLERLGKLIAQFIDRLPKSCMNAILAFGRAVAAMFDGNIFNFIFNTVLNASHKALYVGEKVHDKAGAAVHEEHSVAVTKGLSFGLLMACFGICAILLYVLISTLVLD